MVFNLLNSDCLILLIILCKLIIEDFGIYCNRGNVCLNNEIFRVILVLIFGCCIFIMIFCLLSSVVWCVWFIDVDVNGCLLNWVNILLIGFFVCCLIVCLIILKLLVWILFCNFLNLLVNFGLMIFVCEERIWLILINVGLSFLNVVCI